MDFTLETVHDYTRCRFQAMASPCEILLDTQLNTPETQQYTALLSALVAETRRIEQKFSRYVKDNIVYRINHAQGEAVEVDTETARLLDYAQQCYQLSEGLFDITSGILGKIWHFDGSDHIPGQAQIDACLDRVGWEKITWNNPLISLPQGMQLDFGGIGKEYAVDRCAQLIKQQAGISSLVNFGGDIAVTQPRADASGWQVGLEKPDQNHTAVQHIELKQGAVATSGDSRRFVLKDGVRYSHILNPKTGWPVSHAPRSVTVIANTCTEAGMLSTLAMLHGADAEAFLDQQGIRYWCIR